MEDLCTILTGDLIASTDASPAETEAAMALLADCAAELGPDSRFTRHRGDGWQMRLTDPGDCLAACLYILARLHGAPLGSRISVGIGGAEIAAGADLSAATGTAFVASGRGLDAMGKGEILAISGSGVDAFQRQCFAFAADYAARWSREQAQAMALALSAAEPTQAEIATQLGISRQAVGLRLKAAGHHLLRDAAQTFRSHIWPEDP